MQPRQPGDLSSPSKERSTQDSQSQSQPPRSKSQQSRIETHYELEFDNESSVYARKLIVDAERVSLRSNSMLMSEPNIAEYGNPSRHRHSKSFASHNTSLSRCSSSSDPPDLLLPLPSAVAAAAIPFPSQQLPSLSPTRLTYSNSPLQTSPERERRKSREELSLLRQVPENGDPMEFHSEPTRRHRDSAALLEGVQEHQDADNQRRQFPVLISESPTPEDDAAEEEEEEEEQWILDEELARQGLYRGSYHQLIGIYTLTPVFTLLIFLALAFLPSIAYPLPSTPTPPYPYAPYLPYPLPEILTATAFWALSYLLNSFLFSFFSSTLPNHHYYPFLLLSSSSLFQSTITVTLRQAIIPILLISCGTDFDRPTWHDFAFRRTWWLALGWAAAEAIVGIKQGYEGIALYRDVLVSVRRVAFAPSYHHQKPLLQQEQGGQQQQTGIPLSGYGGVGTTTPPHYNFSSPGGDYIVDAERQPLLHERRSSHVSSSSSSRSVRGDGGPHQSDAAAAAAAAAAVCGRRDAIEEEVERDVDELIALRRRGELEDLYGMPFIHLPTFIPCLHRLNSALFTLGSILLITAAYMRSSLSLKLEPPPPLSLNLLLNLLPLPSSHNNEDWTTRRRLQGNTQLFITFSIIVLLHWVLALLHTSFVLPRIGVQTFVYVGLLVSLGVFFAGLGVWEGIV